MVEKLLRNAAVVLDRCCCEPLPIMKMLLEVNDQIGHRRSLDTGGGTNTPSTQELQQLRNHFPLDLSSRGTNASVSVSTAILIPLDLRFTKIRQPYPALCKPTVKSQPVARLDVNDAHSVLLFDQ
jgi:hypothetical protein